MSTKVQPRIWMSGWCSTGIYDWQHEKCRYDYDRNGKQHRCGCDCHSKPKATDVAAPSWTVYWIDVLGDLQTERGWSTREDADRFVRWLIQHGLADIESVAVDLGEV